eukprot:TRINITY_DN37754_c0_g1_i2.p1 TRINITY_DN37754_c0_g1~~TRINITY_DN37754_c0_g1_i2.p1  ORF type:complete len:111 (+),score=16.87 TRINITY_DN37754_c0_g1_i2:186-518(+)
MIFNLCQHQCRLAFSQNPKGIRNLHWVDTSKISYSPWKQMFSGRWKNYQPLVRLLVECRPKDGRWQIPNHFPPVRLPLQSAFLIPLLATSEADLFHKKELQPNDELGLLK